MSGCLTPSIQSDPSDLEDYSESSSVSSSNSHPESSPIFERKLDIQGIIYYSAV